MTPSPAAPHHGAGGRGPQPAASMSPTGVSPSTDLAAHAGAMLIDNPSARFNSPCHRFQSDPGRDSQDLAPFRPPSRQHSSSEADHSRAPSRSAAEPWQLATVPVGVLPQQLQLQNPLAQESLSRDNEDQDEWCADIANILPESLSEDLLRMRKSPVSASGLPTQQAPLPNSSAHAMGSMPMLPIGSATYLPVTGLGWNTSRSEPVPNAREASSPDGGDVASRSVPTLPTVGIQHQQAQLVPAHSTGQPLASGAGAMEQLALSTAATVDLLAGMAASSSQAHPHSASDLILAASATLQAFARSAQSTQMPFSGLQGSLPNGASVISQAGQGLSHLPEHQRQQVAFMQQQWQLQQQQCWYRTNGA